MLDPILRRTRGRLPHWTAADATYFVTFRLFDSLPKELVDRFVFERRNIIQTAKQMRRELSDAERNRLHQLRIQIDSYLDQSHGKCYMRDEAIASMVAGALQYFEGVRYHLLAWCVMPNHVHSVVQLLENWELKQVLHSWKSFTAHQAVQKYHCSKPFWQVESYDHIVRTETELERAITYVENNPIAAGLMDWKWVSNRANPVRD
jgi:REP element-mobilizing transposase RayT